MRKKIILLALALIAGIVLFSFSLLIAKEIEKNKRQEKRIIAIAGEPLKGTGEARLRGESVSLSPNGRWLLYYSDQSTLTDPALVLFDNDRRERYKVQLSPAATALAKKRRIPYMTGGCWDMDSSRVWLLGMQGTDLFYIAIAQERQPFMLALAASSSVKARRAVHLCDSGKHTTPPVQVKRDGKRHLSLVDLEGNTLAEFRARWSQTRIDVEDLTLSPSGRYLSFILTGYRGSFSTGGRGYILPLILNESISLLFMGEPIIGPLMWAPRDKYLYAFKAAGSGQGQFFRWQPKNN